MPRPGRQAPEKKATIEITAMQLREGTLPVPPGKPLPPPAHPMIRAPSDG